MIHVVAIVTAKPGQRETILEAFKANVAAVRAEQGCIEYQATVDAPDAGPAQAPFGKDTFVVVEKWADMAAYAARTRELIASRTIHILSPVAA